jgi:C-terminal processing protease CtpA/Prc
LLLARSTNYNPAMARFLPVLVCVALTVRCQAQDTSPVQSTDRSDLTKIVSFEAQPNGGMPGGWGGGPPGTIFADDKLVHGGRWSARIQRHAGSPGDFSSLTKAIPMDFAGTSIEFRGFLRTEDVNGFVGLWMREDGESSGLAFDNMQSRQLEGTTGWKEYSITLPVKLEGRQLFFGVLLAGTGKAWADDLQLLVDGKPIWDAPKVQHPKTALDLDHQFDSGSGLAISKLTEIQVENLATLGKVWGFLKYHHPKVTSGQLHWDYELLRVLPAILDAPDRAAANATLVHWIAGLGPAALCNPCAKLDESNLYLRSDLRWIDDDVRLGKVLCQTLRSIRDNRAGGKQFYISHVPGVGNPSFDHEPGYQGLKLPDPGFQLLALYRFWNIIEYWFPYRDVMGEDWEKVLTDFIPKIVLAGNSESYQRELMALIAKVHDGHANLWSSLEVRPPVGKCQVPVKVRFVENSPVVAGFAATEAATTSGLKIGDVIAELDGVPVPKLMENWTPYYADSNEAARLRDIAAFMTRGACGESSIGVRREGQDIKLKTERVPPSSSDVDPGWHDLPGEIFRRLSNEVAYLKLSSVKAADASRYIEAATGTKGLIIDIRNYPSQFVVFALGSLLVDHETPFARFTVGELSNPGTFHWTEPVSLSPQKPHYTGKVVILVDEISQSQAEYTAMALRAAPHAMVVGSTTSGNDGNVSPMALPGGLRAMISGIGVFYPDKRPTQRIGIVPDVEVRPTIAGIRAGRDEVLEEALRQILGRVAPAAQIEKIYKH